MAVGLEDPSSGGVIFGDYNNHKSFPTKHKKSWNPSNTNLIDEIKRRKQINGDVSKTSIQMKKNVALTWLKEHPLTNEIDKSFVLQKVSTFLSESQAAAQEAANKSSAANPSSQQWSGIVPYLRLIHAICDFEEIRSAFHKDFTVLSREELDARNKHDAQLNSPWTLASDKWNDEQFDCKSTVYHDLHDDFSTEIDLSFSAVKNMGILTPDKAKQKFFKLKNDLVVVKSRYEISGNGDGTVSRTQVESNKNEDRNDPVELELINANDRRNFLNGKSPATLYLWEKAEEYGLLTSVCQQLDPSSAVDSVNSDDSDEDEGTGRKQKKTTGDKDPKGPDDDGLNGLKQMMDNSNKQMEAATAAKKEINLTNLISAERTRMYAVKDQVDDAPDGLLRKRRLERRLAECEQRIAEYENRLKKVRGEGDEGGM